MRSNQVTLTCTPNTAVCGNGKIEVGEQCDDGNQVACDGCAPTCRLERCGDGIVECGEECDDGPANGTPGSKCTATCTELVPPLRIPGGGSKRTDCLLETSIDMQTPTLKGDGTPSNKQVCVDNDPTCDFDPNPGSCQFHVWLCFGGDDARIACGADSVPLPAGERCAKRVDVDVTAGKKDGKLSLKVSDPLGDRDTDSIKLKCAAAP
jgi:cysteine-rich repeat protein